MFIWQTNSYNNDNDIDKNNNSIYYGGKIMQLRNDDYAIIGVVLEQLTALSPDSVVASSPGP